MGTALFDISKVAETTESARGRLVTSGAHTTSTTASDLTDGAAGAGSPIAGIRGQILTIKPDEDMRVRFGGDAATATLGHIVPANETSFIEIPGDGAISIVDVA